MTLVIKQPLRTIELKEIPFKKESFLKMIRSLRGKSCKLVVFLKNINQKNEPLRIEEQIDLHDNDTLMKKFYERIHFIINNNESHMKIEIPSKDEIKDYLKEEK